MEKGAVINLVKLQMHFQKCVLASCMPLLTGLACDTIDAKRTTRFACSAIAFTPSVTVAGTAAPTGPKMANQLLSAARYIRQQQPRRESGHEKAPGA